MAGPRAEKVAVVEEVRDRLGRSGAAILTEYRGLKVADLAALRRSLRVAGAEYKVYKNTLVRRATTESGHGAILALLEGPTAIAFVDNDVAAAAKVLRDFARTHPALVVKGSLIGTDLLDARSTTALADLPTRDVLLALIAGTLAAPMQKFAGLLQALPRNLAYGIAALVEKRIESGEVLPEPTAVAADEAPVPEPVTEAPAPVTESPDVPPAPVTQAADDTAAAPGDDAGGADSGTLDTAAETATAETADDSANAASAADGPAEQAADESADATGAADEPAVLPATAAAADAEAGAAAQAAPTAE